MNHTDYNESLGVTVHAIGKESERADQQAAQPDHPDKNTHDKLAQRLFNKVYKFSGNGYHTWCGQPAIHDYRSLQTGGNSAEFDFAKWFGGDTPNFQQSPASQPPAQAGDVFDLGADTLIFSTRKQQGI